MKKPGDNAGDLICEQRGNGVADLMILRRARPLKKIIVRERLQPRRLAHGQAAALGRIVVDEIMSVLGYVRGNGGGRTAPELDAEPVVKHGAGDGFGHVFMVGQKFNGKMFQSGRLFHQPGELGGKQVAVQILANMAARGVIAKTGNPD